jgi:large subunit ribosomal protein L30
LSKKADERKCIAAVRVRGSISAQREAKDTLDMLHLGRTNHAVLVDNRPAFIGMLHRVQAYVTWGEASKETVALMLQKRGRLAGDKKLTDEYAVKVGYKSLGDLADAVASCKAEHWKLPDMQPLFKLRPPTKGFKGKIKKSFRSGGEAGYRGEKINELIKRMV